MTAPRCSNKKMQEVVAFILEELGECETMLLTIEPLIEYDERTLNAVRERLDTVETSIETWLMSPTRLRARIRRQRDISRSRPVGRTEFTTSKNGRAKTPAPAKTGAP